MENVAVEDASDSTPMSEGTGAASMASFAHVLNAGHLEVIKFVKTSQTQVAGVICEQVKNANIEVAKCFSLYQTQTFKDIFDANVQLGVSKEKERLFSEQLAAASAENSRLSRQNMELAVELEVAREHKKLKTEEVDALNKKLNEQEVGLKAKLNNQEKAYTTKLKVHEKTIAELQIRNGQHLKSINELERENGKLENKLNPLKEVKKLKEKIEWMKRGVEVASDDGDDDDDDDDN